MGLFGNKKKDSMDPNLNLVGKKIIDNDMYKEIKHALNTMDYDIMSAFIDSRGFVNMSIYPYGTKDYPTLEVIDNQIKVSTIGVTHLDIKGLFTLIQNFTKAYKVAKYIQSKIDDKSIYELAHI